VRSADWQLRRAAAVAAVPLAAASVLAGCSTTQQKAARLQLENARLRAAQLSTRVSAAGPTVSATGISLVRRQGRTAFVVTVRNRGGRPVSDLPISVGYRLGAGAAVYLNSAAGTGYFDAHLPLIGSDRAFRWIYTTARAIPADARPFARVGASSTVRVAGLASPPAIAAAVKTGTAGGAIRINVRNLSGVTQYQLPVYAVASRGPRVLAVATGTISELGGGSSKTLRLRLLGSAAGAHVDLETQPTIFQ
jgi:hypothetical protein